MSDHGTSEKDVASKSVAVAAQAAEPCAWQPIETLPHDGEVLLYDATASRPQYVGQWFPGYTGTATHWMPLREPPEQSKQ